MTTRFGNTAIKAALCFAIFLCIGLSPSNAAADYIRIKGTVVNVRQGPGTTYQVLFQAKQGDEFDLLKTEGLWCLISLDQGEKAWVFGRLIEILPGERPSKRTIQPGPEGDQPRWTAWMAHYDRILIILLVIFALTVLWKRRQVLDYAQKKLREISGYRREQPFRYDNRNPKDDRWEL